MPHRRRHPFPGVMDLLVLLVIVPVSLALLIRIDRGIKLLEHIADTLDSAEHSARDADPEVDPNAGPGHEEPREAL